VSAVEAAQGDAPEPEPKKLPRRKRLLVAHAQGLAKDLDAAQVERDEALRANEALRRAADDAREERETARAAQRAAEAERDAARQQHSDELAIGARLTARVGEVIAQRDALQTAFDTYREEVRAVGAEPGAAAQERDELAQWRREAEGILMHNGWLTGELHKRAIEAETARDEALARAERLLVEHAEAKRVGMIAVSAVENLGTIIGNAMGALRKASEGS
jgi:hypothetical protein